jgi:hypothetical protein
MSRARELAKLGGSGQQTIAGVSSHVGVSTFAANVFMYQDLSVSGNINVTGDLTYDEVSARNQFTSGITTTADLIVTRNANFSGIITAAKGVAGNINATGVSTAAFLQATTVNASGIVTAGTFSGSGASLTGVPISTGVSGLGANVATFLATPTSANLISVVSDETGSGALVFGTTPTLVNPTVTGSVQGNINATGVSTATTLSGTTATYTNITANGGFAGNINATGVSTAAFLQATTVNVSAAATVGGNLTVTGDLTVNGTTTTINSTTITVDDKNIELGSVASPTDITADGGGITLKGATDKTFTWSSSTNAWTSSEDINVVTGKQYEINGTAVLTSSQVLGKSVPTGTIVGTTDTQTLTNKTLTTPVISSISNSGTITIPSSTDTLVGRATTDTLTNKTIAAGSNTITGLTNSNLSGTAGITNANLANSTISGVALGSNLNALTISTGLSGSSYNGSGAVTIAIDSTVCTLTGTQTLTNKTIGAATISGNIAPNANNTIDLGSSANRWANVYSNDLDLSNEGGANSIDGTWGSYLVQEGEEHLYIINRRSGKKFRFVLEEV